MLNITIDQTLHFHFEDNWKVVKYDETPYYKTQLKNQRSCKINKKDKSVISGLKGVDLVALQPQDNTLYLIECKDYRLHSRKKNLHPVEEFYQKTMDTLAGLLPSALCGTSGDPNTRMLKALVRSAEHIRLVFHFEQAETTNKLMPRAYDIADLQQKLRGLLKAIDPYVLVVDIDTLRRTAKVDWTVD
ncbi:MAG: hypothetical protein GX561_09720 [Lentisphaerae bacterium]|jgi:hypothetical protein|nr:hypothetical protein [Lentisphaerota bacterium]